MKFDIAAWLAATTEEEDPPVHLRVASMLRLRPLIECADGLTLSVQASAYHYCTPRDNGGRWYSVEVGFPSLPLEELREWADDPDALTATVYANVPIEVVERIVNEHGGIIADNPNEVASQ